MSTLLRRQVADADAKILAKEQELDRMLRKQPDDLRKVAEQSLQESDNSAKAQKHITKFQKATHPQRMALKK